MGRHLLALGVPTRPGGRRLVLKQVYEQQLDGEIAQLDEAIAAATRLLRSERPAGR